MSDIIKRITGKQKTRDIPRAVVKASLGRNYYKVKDDLGRFFNVYSATAYKIGSVVRISSDQIVGPGDSVTKVKIVKV